MTTTRQRKPLHTLKNFVRLVLPTMPLIILALLLLFIAQSAVTNPNLALSIGAWKDVFIMVASGILALTGSYVGATLQIQQEKEREWREARRTRTDPYRKYLLKVLSFAQRMDTVRRLNSRGKETGADELIPSDDRKSIGRELPPIKELSAIDSEDCRKAVDEAIEFALNYISSNENHISAIQVQEKYWLALDEIEQYETN